MFCNGRKLGFAVRRSANEERRVMLKKLESMTFGAGVLPSGSGSGESDLDEVMYMSADTTVRAQNMAIDNDSPAKQPDSHVVQERPPIAEGQARFSNAHDLLSLPFLALLAILTQP
ncbi:hypothetical protein F2Q68_00031732 [Brassica cretica]|uniref:Uncharacterized protein n=2 Tax=Brassica cretica TaxID=69181 RepID=A0ABQ7BRM3_BRACR|nr:hypothetical protein F2Q68_00031732 [Brassica cretica]KAF3534771.1 hypothetical protein DY000_02041594 [Brassica cretica]